MHIHIHIHTHMYLHTRQGRHMGLRTSLCCEQSGRWGDQDTHASSWGLDDSKIETALSQQNPTHKPPTSGQHRHSLTCWKRAKEGSKDMHAPAGGWTAAVAHTHIHTCIEDTYTPSPRCWFAIRLSVLSSLTFPWGGRLGDMGDARSHDVGATDACGLACLRQVVGQCSGAFRAESVWQLS